MMPTLTVVIPMFDSGRTVAAALRSVLCQELDELRVVVVNDGSTDHGPSVVERIAREDAGVRMVSQHNRGLAAARNTGLEAALESGTDFVHFLDADDWMLPGSLAALLGGAGETGASYGGYALVDDDGRNLGRESPVSAPIVGLDEELEWNRAATHARLLSREAIGDERFDETLPVCEDLEMWLRLETRGVRFKAVERMVAAYRVRPTSLSKRFGTMCRVYEDVVRRAFVRAMAGGWGERIDLSESRLARVVGHSALMYATMESLGDPTPSKARGAAVLEGALHPARFSAAQLAQAACTAVLFGAGIAPELDGAGERAWLVPLRQWWVRCAEEGWCRYEDVDPAMRELAAKIVHPGEIAESMLESAAKLGHASEQGAIVVGLDRNGRRLVRACAGRGWRVLAVDVSSDPRERALLEPLAGTRTERTGSHLARVVSDGFADACWTTGLVGLEGVNCGAAVAQEAGVRLRRVEMWEEHRERLGARNFALVRDALAGRGRMAG